MLISTPQEVKIKRMIVQKCACKLESQGMKHSRISVIAQCKREYNLKGNKKSVYTQMVALCDKVKAEAGY